MQKLTDLNSIMQRRREENRVLGEEGGGRRASIKSLRGSHLLPACLLHDGMMNVTTLKVFENTKKRRRRSWHLHTAAAAAMTDCSWQVFRAQTRWSPIWLSQDKPTQLHECRQLAASLYRSSNETTTAKTAQQQQQPNISHNYNNRKKKTCSSSP